jgi:threonine synthase
MSFITHLECSNCLTRHDHRQVQTVCTKCGKTLLARYDLASARRTLAREAFKNREGSLWRYKELLPVLHDENIIALGEGYTPIRQLKRLGSELGLSDLRLKEESYNATGSFKARGLCVAVSKARELGITETCIPTAGNAGSALAAYGAAAGMISHIYLPDDTPRINVDECRSYGADVHLVKGTISDAAKQMKVEKGNRPWFDMSTLKEPYRLEGKKTMGYEIAEQYNWNLPDVVVYPTGGGTGLIGMWKAFEEMQELGWIDERRPKMVSVQSSGCAPIVKAFESHAESSELWDGAATIASGLRVPKAFADSLILQAVYQSNGAAIAVSDESILETIRRVAAIEGLLLCPEGAAAIAALTSLRERGVVGESTSTLVYNTGSSLKYAEVLQMVASPH